MFLQLIRQQAERINEMTSIMYKAVNMDAHGDTRREEELYQRLITENKVGEKYLLLLDILKVAISKIKGQDM